MIDAGLQLIRRVRRLRTVSWAIHDHELAPPPETERPLRIRQPAQRTATSRRKTATLLNTRINARSSRCWSSTVESHRAVPPLSPLVLLGTEETLRGTIT